MGTLARLPLPEAFCDGSPIARKRRASVPILRKGTGPQFATSDAQVNWTLQVNLALPFVMSRPRMLS